MVLHYVARNVKANHHSVKIVSIQQTVGNKAASSAPLLESLLTE